MERVIVCCESSALKKKILDLETRIEMLEERFLNRKNSDSEEEEDEETIIDRLRKMAADFFGYEDIWTLSRDMYDECCDEHITGKLREKYENEQDRLIAKVEEYLLDEYKIKKEEVKIVLGDLHWEVYRNNPVIFKKIGF